MDFDGVRCRQRPLRLNSIKIKIFPVITFTTIPRICKFFMADFIRFSQVCYGQARTSFPRDGEKAKSNNCDKMHCLKLKKNINYFDMKLPFLARRSIKVKHEYEYNVTLAQTSIKSPL